MPRGVALVLCCLAVAAWAARPAGAAEIAVGDLRASFTPYQGLMPTTGLRVTFGNLPLITRSSVNIISPDWSKAYLTLGRAQGRATTSDVPGGQRITFTTASDAATLEYTVDLLQGNRVVLDLRGTLLKDEPAVVEYGAGYVTATLLAGQPYQAVTDEGERSGTMPLSATASEPRAAMVMPPVRRLQVASRIGALSVESTVDDPGLDLFDARRMTSEWLQESPIFWLGRLAAPIKAGQPFHSHVTLQVTPAPETARPERPAGPALSLPAREVAEELLPAAPDGEIVPAPQERRAGRGAFTVTAGTRIVYSEDTASRRAAYELQERLEEGFGRSVPAVPASLWPDHGNVIVIGSNASPTIAAWLAEARLKPVAHPEGYALQVTPRHVLVAGADARGTLYGVFTLLQLAPSPKDPVAFTAATIRDWPAIPVRAVHLLTDNWSAFLHRDLIRRVLAPHKINTILLECEYVQWDSHPEIHVPWGMTKEEVRQVVAEARDYGIEVIPLVQMLGHTGWMFQNGQHLDLAEDPQTKYAYCPSNPKTYDFLFDILNEVIQLFDHPRFVHIGHDEFTHRGKFAQDGPCKGKDPDDLFLEDTLKLHDWLARHGARTMIWGDMILGPGEAADAANAKSVAEAARLRERLPKDILIADWHYQPAPEYPSVQILRDAGFEVWGATWYRPENVAGFAREVAQHASGLIQTTWTGYSGNMTALRNWFPQLWAYVLAADFAWSPQGRTVAEAQSLAPRRFLGVWPGLSRAARPTPGFTLDLDPLGNMPWRDSSARDGWLGYGPEHDLSALPVGLQRLGDRLFLLPAGRKAVALASPLLPARYPATARIPVGRRASELSLLMASGWEVAENRKVGRVTVAYADGTRLPIDLLYGWNIRAVGDRRTAFLAPIVWEGKTAAGEPLYLRAYTLGNPLPDKEIAAIELSSDETEAAPLLLAVAGE